MGRLSGVTGERVVGRRVGRKLRTRRPPPPTPLSLGRDAGPRSSGQHPFLGRGGLGGEGGGRGGEVCAQRGARRPTPASGRSARRRAGRRAGRPGGGGG